MAPSDKDIPISRAVGRFFGHLWNAAAKPVEPEAPKKQRLRETHEERDAEVDGKPVILRRTTIEEIEFKGDSPDKPQ